ncbi:Hypothetical protein PMT_2284 [Prochlorococcus marinus str. MIT 9313]|uniref:Uncharacterized protein n=1 Tax=Prochlorococcus marinus (strain MIT 9313) TaxID=74547 RepID=B9ERC3_PROMM|nr:Hypothetical protein PMT_2284 [Prochlorococcus marinus str. MIT 9313]
MVIHVLHWRELCFVSFKSSLGKALCVNRIEPQLKPGAVYFFVCPDFAFASMNYVQKFLELLDQLKLLL